MSLDAWREMWPLMILEASAVSSRPRIWFRRYALAALVSLALVAVLAARLGREGEPVHEVGESLAGLMSLLAYVMAAGLAPLLALGAVEAARRTGMLDLVIASPVPQRKILLALVGGRLLATALFFAPVLPLLVIPIYLAGMSVLGGILWAAVLAVLAATLSTSFAILLASSGRSPAALGARLLTFIVFTPAASSTAALCLVLLFVEVIFFMSTGLPEVAHALGVTCFGGVLPFWGLGAAIFASPPECFYLAAGALVAGLVTMRLAHDESLDRFASWIERLHEPRSREVSSYVEVGGWRRVLPAVARRWRRAESTEEVGEPEESRETLTSITRGLLLKVSGVEKAVYKITRRNPLLLRRILGWIDAPVVACFSVFSVYVIATGWQVVYGHRVLAGQEPEVAPRALSMGLGLLLGAYLSAEEGSRLLPSRLRAGFWQSLLSSPVTGMDIAIGGAASVFLRVAPLLGVLLLVGFLPIGRNFDPAGSAALLVLIAAIVLLTYGISLWVSLVLERPGERMAASLALFLVWVALFETAMRASIPSGGSAPRSAGELFAVAAVTAGVGLVLAGAFAALFRKLVRA